MSARREIAIVFDGPPGPEAGRFVEVEVAGSAVKLGRWEQVSSYGLTEEPGPDGLGPPNAESHRWELRFTAADVERVTAGGPWLDHVYNGKALRILAQGWLEPEQIAGAFAVLYRDDRSAIIDNGEGGEAHGRWLVNNLDRLSPARSRCSTATTAPPSSTLEPAIETQRELTDTEVAEELETLLTAARERLPIERLRKALHRGLGPVSVGVTGEPPREEEIDLRCGAPLLDQVTHPGVRRGILAHCFLQEGHHGSHRSEQGHIWQ